MPTAETGADAMTLDEPGLGVATAFAGDGRVVVRFAGELDVATAPRLHQALLGIIDGRGCSVLDLDLSQLRFVDSTGLGVLVRAQRCLRSDGGELRLCNASPPVAGVLDISGLGCALRQASAAR